MSPASITRTLHSRGVMIAMILAVTAFAVTAFVFGVAGRPVVTNGFVSSLSGVYQLRLPVSVCAGAAATVVVSLLLNYINRVYNLLRAHTSMQSTMFLLMMLATPALAIYLNTGLLLCVVVLLCTMLLYREYGHMPCDTRHVFMVFFLLSGCSSFDFRYALYVPVFVIGCQQMRILSLRTLLAILIGIVTPWVIAFGFGLLTPRQLQWPRVSWLPAGVPTIEDSLFMGVALYTALVTAGCLLQCVIKIMTYTAHTRAQLGFVTVLTVATMVFTIATSADLSPCLPLLNCCAALQMAHLFSAIHTYSKSYVAILMISAIYILAICAQVVLLVVSYR